MGDDFTISMGGWGETPERLTVIFDGKRFQYFPAREADALRKQLERSATALHDLRIRHNGLLTEFREYRDTAVEQLEAHRTGANKLRDEKAELKRLLSQSQTLANEQSMKIGNLKRANSHLEEEAQAQGKEIVRLNRLVGEHVCLPANQPTKMFREGQETVPPALVVDWQPTDRHHAWCCLPAGAVFSCRPSAAIAGATILEVEIP